MPNITTRAGKGSALTWDEMDSNFVELDNRTKISWQNMTSPLQVAGMSNPPPTVLYHGTAVYGFDKTSSQTGSTYFHLPHDYVPNSPIYPHIHFVMPFAGSGNVRWGMTYTYAKEYVQGGDNTYARFGSPQTVYLEKLLDPDDLDMHRLVEFDIPLQGNGLEKDSVILMNVFRDSLHPNDTLDGQVLLLAVDIYYQSQGMGTAGR